jgi:hypothetical protein
LKILQQNTCKENKLLPWIFITKASFDAFIVSLQELLVCNFSAHWFLEAKCWVRGTSFTYGL